MNLDAKQAEFKKIRKEYDERVLKRLLDSKKKQNEWEPVTNKKTGAN